MKTKYFTSVAFVLLLSMTHVLFAKGAKSGQLPDITGGQRNNINVMVHPQVELVSIVQAIGNYPSILPFLMAESDFDYRTSVLEHFSPFAGHPAVQMFDRLSGEPRKLNFSAPSNIMLYTDKDLVLRQDIQPDDFVISRIYGLDSLNIFLGLLQDFAEASGFNAFYQSNVQFYQTIIGQTLNHIGNHNYIKEIEDFFGRPQQSYNIVLVSLYGSLGYGNWLLLPNGKREIYNTMGPLMVKDGLPFFGDENHLKHMIRHEFSHPFINPVTELYRDEIMPYAAFYDLVPALAKQNVCGEWEECINEFIIRAITTWLAQQECPELGQWAYSYELERGVANLDELLQKINYYQANRNKYPTLNDFYPQLLEEFMPGRPWLE